MIHFIRPDSDYSKILDSFIDPIKEHIEATVSPKHEQGKVNVSFFTEYEASEVFMSHGIADKNWRTYRRVKDFHYICASGQLWVDRYIREGCPKEKILLVGYPKLDPIFQGKFTRTPGSKRVLWAPTHNATPKVSSYPRFRQYLEMFPCEVVSSIHPARRGGSPTMQALVDADVVISDCSSLIYEAWSLGKPVIFPDWLVKDGVLRSYPGSVESAIYEYGIGLHARSFDEMIDMLDGEIDDRVTRFMEQMFPTELRGCSGKRTAEVLRSLE